MIGSSVAQERSATRERVKESSRRKSVSRNKTQEAMSVERIQGKTREVKSSMRMNKIQ
jgi:hypothetical protein